MEGNNRNEIINFDKREKVGKNYAKKILQSIKKEEAITDKLQNYINNLG